VNSALFEWVIENVSKNAIDAMEGFGKITIQIAETEKHAIIDISDTGKGIPKSAFKKIFNPGFTTKQRGWGLGLSLARRIIEEYHNGKIFVRHSEVGKGSCIRIVLNKGKY
jgi:signal transduction histidine kinase